MEKLQKILLVFTIIGAINWGLLGLLNVNLITMLFQEGSVLTKIIYILVGICGLVNIGIFFYDLDRAD